MHQAIDWIIVGLLVLLGLYGIWSIIDVLIERWGI